MTPGSGGVPDAGANVTFSGNRTGCNSIAEILDVASLIAAGQTCGGRDITLSSQAAVDAFHTAFGPCTHIPYRLTITGADIIDLGPLIGLSTIGSDLTISNNPQLTSLNGLGSIVSTGYQLRIQNNPLLTDAGMVSMSSVGTDLTVDTNAVLPALDGFENLVSTGNQLRVQKNPVLTRMALTSLVRVGTDFTIANNAALPTLDGLESAVATRDKLSVLSNPVLTNLDGLIGFLRVGTDLDVESNA